MMGVFIRFCQDILFPVFCVECGREGEWWCEICRRRSTLKPPLLCPVCERKTEEGETCRSCQAVSYLDGLTALFSYEENTPGAKLIHHFKYRYARDVTEVWRELLMAETRRAFWVALSASLVIIPVPLHPRRERERGFNQARVIAEILQDVLLATEHSSRLVSNDLRRVRFTRQQAKLSKEERKANIHEAFAWSGSIPSPRAAMLVDDVYTTGTTMQECARALKQHGAERVWGLVLGRG